MKRFFAPNIDRKGRLGRGLMGLALLAGAAFTFRESLWLAALLAAAGVFGLFEAFRGWCLARAWGQHRPATGRRLGASLSPSPG